MPTLCEREKKNRIHSMIARKKPEHKTTLVFHLNWTQFNHVLHVHHSMFCGNQSQFNLQNPIIYELNRAHRFNKIYGLTNFQIEIDDDKFTQSTSTYSPRHCFPLDFFIESI